MVSDDKGKHLERKKSSFGCLRCWDEDKELAKEKE